MRLYKRKLVNYIFKPKIDIAEKHHRFSLFLSYLMNTLRFEPAIRMYFCELVLIINSSCPHSVSCFVIISAFKLILILIKDLKT